MICVNNKYKYLLLLLLLLLLLKYFLCYYVNFPFLSTNILIVILIANTSPWCEKIVSNAGAHHPSVVINIPIGWSIAGQLFGPLHIFFQTSRSLLSILATCLLVIGRRCQLLYPWLETAEPFSGSVTSSLKHSLKEWKEGRKCYI